MHVHPESVTHLVVKLFNVKSKFDYIDENKKKIGDCKQLIMMIVMREGFIGLCVGKG
jgi:hypothetical protein